MSILVDLDNRFSGQEYKFSLLGGPGAHLRLATPVARALAARLTIPVCIVVIYVVEGNAALMGSCHPFPAKRGMA